MFYLRLVRLRVNFQFYCVHMICGEICELSSRFVICVGAAAMMSAVYEEHKDEDGFLYMTYSGENTFGLIY